jgi:diguanylate cyclase (GGDEF)-like protein
VDREAAERAAERILQALRDDALHLPDDRTLILRASVGMAEVGNRESMAAAIGRADDALYAAKAAGRDTWRWAQTAH